MSYIVFLDHLKIKHEYELFKKEYYKVDYPKDGIFPSISDTQYETSCKIIIHDLSYELDAYKEFLEDLFQAALHDIRKEIFRVNNKKDFLQHIRNSIKQILDSYAKPEYPIKDCYKVVSNNADIVLDEIGKESIEGYIRPFFQAYLKTLESFKDIISKELIKVEPRKRVKRVDIQFKYKTLYTDQVHKRDVKDTINRLTISLREANYLSNNSGGCLMYYFGLSSVATKISWKENAGDFYTFYRFFKSKKIVVGHYKSSLPDYVVIHKGVEWTRWNSMKHTKNRLEVERILMRFVNELELLSNLHTAPNTAQ